jgi:hypothetical protein
MAWRHGSEAAKWRNENGENGKRKSAALLFALCTALTK